MLIRPGFSGVDPWAGVACKGGGGTSSSSSSDTKDQRNAVGGSGIVAGQGSTVNFTIENPDGFAALLAAGVGLFEANLEFASDRAESSALAYANAAGMVASANQSESLQLGLQALKSAGPILLIVGIGAALVMAAKNG